MRPVKVCCFCEKWESGGIESFLHNVFLCMDMAAVQIDIVTAELSESVFTQPLRERGIRFVELSGKQQKVIENHRLFKKLLRQEKYDVVHLNIFHGLSLWYGSLAMRVGVPARIAHSHNTALRKSRTRPVKLLVHQAAKEVFAGSATDLWACSRQAAQFMFPSRVLKGKGFQFIPNGIDTDRFRFNAAVREKVRKELGVQGQYVMGHIGRLCYQKNQDFLLDVFYEVMKRRPESILLLVGEGPDRSALEEKAGRLGIADNVIFYGTSDRVERLLWAMDVFVMPSRFEGLPVTAVEAQASGLPCLFSKEITEECRLSHGTIFLSMKGGPVYWAEILLKFQRSDSVFVPFNGDFEIRMVAKRIKQEWTRQRIK